MPTNPALRRGDDKLPVIQMHVGIHIGVVNTNAFLPKKEKKSLD